MLPIAPAPRRAEGASRPATSARLDWGLTEKEMLATIEPEKLLAVERATLEKPGSA